ncbi:MAG: hypothetical protein JO356_10525, partial [Acidobacteria bacterium]|nr:hypothetical protein [Acidobacteriota bacterium]
LESASKPLIGGPYLRSKTAPQAVSALLPIFLARGYLKAQLGDPRTTVVEDGSETWIDLRLPVSAGARFNLSSVEWTGNTVLASKQLEALLHLKMNDPVDAIQLARDLETIEKLYGTKGYLYARVYPSSTLDDIQHSVSYELNVIEGDLYRMGDLLLHGLDAEATKKMTAQWQMKKGAPYDNSYLSRFFSLIYRDVGLGVSYQVIPKQSVNSEDKTVSVALQFLPKS